MSNKQKRFYRKGEVVWVIPLKKEGTVKDIDTVNLKMKVETNDYGEEFVGNMWDFDKLKYEPKKKLVKKLFQKKTFLASVNGGVVPTKDKENAGRDCYARLEQNSKGEYRLEIPQLTLAKIPLGFASYLNQGDFLSLKHERSSIGGKGVAVLSGLIDSTYQGEVILQVVPLVHNIVITSNVDKAEYDEKSNTYYLPYKKAIAQAVVVTESDAEDEEISYDELLEKPSNRGTGKEGSTGK